MNSIDKIFWEWARFIEYLASVLGISYELTNLLIFLILQPLIIIILLILLVREKLKNNKYKNSITEEKTPFFIEFTWRLSRIFSILILIFEIFIVYTFSTNQNMFSFVFINDLITNDLITKILIIFFFPAILIVLNFLIFGKFSLWLKKP